MRDAEIPYPLEDRRQVGPPYMDRILKYLEKEFNIVQECRQYRLSLWQCPRFLFILMGLLTMGTILAVYLVFGGRVSPEFLVMTVSLLAIFFLIQTYVIVLAFEKLAETNRLKSEFINITSHQLRGPLTAGRWALDMFSQLRHGKMSIEEQQYVHVLHETNIRMGALVNALLQVSRIEAGAVRWRAERFSLAELSQELQEEAQTFAAANNVLLRATTPAFSTMVFVDREQIRFVIQSLLDNAARYISKKGKVEVSIEKQNDFFRWSVQDNGIGILGRDQKEIFQKFFRGSNAYTLQPSGAGLNLFICREIIQNAGGEIGFKSKEGEGSTFWFLIPEASAVPDEASVKTKKHK